MRKHLIAAGAALAVATASAPAAPAADLPGMGKDIAYDVDVEGQGTYTYAESDGSGGSNGAALTFTYSGEISDGVVFRNASPLDTTGDDIPQGAASGTYTISGAGGSETCPIAADWNPIHGWMRMVDDADLSGVMPLDGSMDLWIRPLDRFDVMFDCAGDSHPSVGLVGMPDFDDEILPDGTTKMGHNPFDIKFNLPRDLVGMGQIQQLDPAKVLEGVACPGYIADQTTTCKLQWSAKVVLTKLWEEPAPSTPGVPSPKPDAKPAPDDDLLVPLVPTKKDDDEDLLVPLVPQGKASLSADAATASFSVSCAAGCSGTAGVTAAGGARGRAAAARPLATARFTVAPGRARRVTVRLGARARRAVRRAGGARITVRATARGRTTTRTLTVRLPRRGARR